MYPNTIPNDHVHSLTTEGFIAQRPTKMLIDTGASLTLINSRLFYELPNYIRASARHLSTKFQ
ncbi:unnamed protein product, partial [Adineta ricciae]